MKRLTTIVLIFLLIFTIWMGFAWGENKAKEKDKVVRTCFLKSSFKEVNLQDARLAMRVWFRKIVSRTEKLKDYRSEVAIVDDLEEMERKLKNKRVDILILSAFDYCRLSQKTNLIPLLLSIKHNNPTIRFLLLVRKDRGINKISQLQDKKVCIHKSGYEDLIRMWLTVLLKEKKYSSCERFFDLNSVKSSKAVLKVYFGQADACAVESNVFKTMVELNPDVGKQLKPLHRSLQLPDGIVAVPAYQDEFVKKTIAEACQDLHRDPEGKQLLIMFKPRFMKNAIRLFKKYRRMKKK